MISRVWRGWTQADRAAGYVEYLEETGLSELKGTPGNRGVFLMHRRVDDDREEFVVMSLWDALGSVVAFAGEDVEAARFYPRDDEFLVQREWTCSHYEVAAGP